MSVKSNAADDWITIKMRRELYKEIAHALSHMKRHGAKKYNSVSAFTQTACMALLDKETKMMAEVVAR